MVASPAEKSIFLNALELGAPEARRVYLDKACYGDAHLRAGVEALLEAYVRLGNPISCTVDTVTVGHAAGSDATAVSPPSALEIGAFVAGRYKLLEVIGEGGMGTVWMAEQTEPVRRKVAVKLVRSGMDSKQVVARFEAERQALALMDHPNIAKVLDGGVTADGRPYFVMELVKGRPITRHCDDHRLPLRERLDLFVQVCRAVQHAHQKGVIHRDIKPSNVLVAPYDGRPVPKVIDFGVAKAAGQPLTDKTLFTGFGAVIGTPEYMSPEQSELNNADIDTRSDVYSLGVLLYELLTGSTPLTRQRTQGAALLEVLRLIREEEAQRPSTRLSTTVDLPTIAVCRGAEPRKLSNLVRGELDWIVLHALEKDRGRRYESASTLALDVERYLADEPVQACPPSAGYRLRKFYRRNRLALHAVALVGLALVLAAGSFGWQVRDRAARVVATEREAALALDEADKLQGQRKWSEALDAVKLAEGILAGAGSEALCNRVREQRKDLDMARRLEELRHQHFNGEGAPEDTAYAAAFREFGIPVHDLDVAAAAALVRARSIRIELTMALDWWASRRPRGGREHLLAVSRAVDQDDWRNRVRDAFVRNDKEALGRLAAAAPVGDQPVQALIFLAWCLDIHEGTVLLRKAQEKYPDDYHVNFGLAWNLERLPKPQLGEALRFYTAAVALCPRNVPARFCLGHVLDNMGRSEEAVVELRKAVELDPRYALAHNRLGIVLRRLGEPYQAIASHTRALDADPTFVVARGNRGRVYAAVGDWAKALADLDAKAELEEFGDRQVQVGCLRWLAGDVRGARQLRERCLTHTAARASADKYTAARIGTIVSDGPADPRAVEWARHAADTNPTAWTQHVLGRAYYRAGQFDRAEQSCRESLRTESTWPGCPLNWLVVAMARARLGQTDEARKWLTMAVEWYNGLPRAGNPAHAVRPRELSSTDWLEFHVLLPEARRTVRLPGGK